MTHWLRAPLHHGNSCGSSPELSGAKRWIFVYQSDTQTKSRPENRLIEAEIQVEETTQ